MKLRNLLLTSALLLSATALFAGHPIDTTKYNIDDYSWTNDTGSQKISVTLTKHNQEDYNYIAYDTSKYSSGWSAAEALETGSGTSVWALQEGVNNIILPETVTTLGVFNTQHTVYSSDNPEEKWMFYRTIVNGVVPTDSVSFGKLDDKGGGNSHSADVSFSKGTFGAPLPAPVVTLLIALACGAGFVMYRNRKQVKA